MCELIPPSSGPPSTGPLTARLLLPLLAGDPHLPRLVVHTDLGRTELSTASLANWSAKVAGLLTDELGVVPGDTVVVRLGAGWQTVPVLLGSWWAGAVLTDVDDPGAAAAFVADLPGADAAADEVFVVSGHPLGAPATNVLAHQRDFTGAVLGQADRFGKPPAVDDAAPALFAAGTRWSVAELMTTATQAAEQFGAGARVLSSAAWSLPDPVLPLVLGALAAEGSLVQLVGDFDEAARERIRADERCTVSWPPS
ncbi:TIGR03089 family protein [Nakamurella lactea]|uniref:TIGR03089 family protein n=1 Tax=Nakamurella lactea TaxID=459515 RepID=UPI0004261912|nr:TIGR03089 family protein [Nakamurella lactea]